MKKAIIAVLATITLSGCANLDAMAKNSGSHSVNIEELQQEAICKSNAAVFYPECQTAQKASTTKYCIADITEEATGRTQKGLQFNINEKDVASTKGNERTYHEEDSTGSTTVVLNTTTGTGSITVMDESQVTHSGTIRCK